MTQPNSTALLLEALDYANAQVFAAKCADDSSRWDEQRVTIKAKYLQALADAVTIYQEAERLAAQDERVAP